jgi:hypothetical protein
MEQAARVPEADRAYLIRPSLLKTQSGHSPAGSSNNNDELVTDQLVANRRGTGRASANESCTRPAVNPIPTMSFQARS